MPTTTTKQSTKYNNALIRLFCGFSVFQLLLHLFYLLASQDGKVLLPTAIGRYLILCDIILMNETTVGPIEGC